MTGFAMKNEPYLRPRIGGVDRLSLYIEGFQRYLADAGVTDLCLEGLEGQTPYEKSGRSGGSTDSGGMAHSVSDLEAQGTGI